MAVYVQSLSAELAIRSESPDLEAAEPAVVVFQLGAYRAHWTAPVFVAAAVGVVEQLLQLLKLR